jgi:hypothetical protein
MKCPACGSGGTVYKCNNCGDVRCSVGGCSGSMGGSKGGASTGGQCKACKKGKYVRIS